MKKKNIFKTLILLPALLLTVLSGCKDEDSFGTADRLFRPMFESESVVSMTWIKIGWERYDGAKYYDLEISTDSFKTVVQTTKTDSTQYTFRNLNYDTRYQIRVRSVGDVLTAAGDTIKSRYNDIELSTMDYPTLMKTPTSADVIDNSIKVKWTLSNLVYSRIDVMLNKDEVYKSVTLTDADNLAGEKIISGLQPQTSYIVKIYSGDEYKGKRTFKTAASEVFQGDIVDLRGYTDEKAKTMLTQLFIDSIATAHPNGLNLILSGGVSYTLETVNIPVSMNIVTGLSFKGKALIAVNGGFGIKTNTDVPSLRFEKIFFTQGTIAGKFKTDGNYGGTYLFNLNQSGGNIGNLTLENCDIKYKRGAIRMQTTSTISTLNINNCVFDSIGGYGIVNNANDASYIGDIIVKNTSMLHSGKLFTCGKAKGINSLTLENVTTCFSPDLNVYMFDYTNNPIPGGLTIKNSLFGIGGGAAVNGIRSTCSKISITNCYKTSDLQWTLTADGTAFVAPINDFVSLGKTTAQTFANTSLSNYKVTDATLVNKIGDPRWW